MAAMAYHLWKRQSGSTFGDDGSGGDGFEDGDYGDNDYDGYTGMNWWWTPTGMAVRYAIVALLFAFVLFFFVGGYWHARRRVRKGLPPLAYHRWTVQRYFRPYNAETRYAQQQQPGQTYTMDQYSYPPPPPAYSSAEVPPPVYQPPEGGSKVMADQSYVHVHQVPVGEARDGTGPAAPAAAAHQ